MMDWLKKLSAELFWDTRITSIDPDRNARWLIERVLERGQWEDWLLLRDNLGRDVLAREAPRLRLQPRERNFLENYLCR